MLSYPPAIGHRIPAAPCPTEPILADADWVGSIDGEEHMVVLGGHGPELVCALLRAGATNVTHLRAQERPEAESASLMIVPSVPSVDWLATALPSLRRALIGEGRLVLRITPRPGMLIEIRRMLTLNGLSTIETRPHGEGHVISARRPARQFD